MERIEINAGKPTRLKTLVATVNDELAQWRRRAVYNYSIYLVSGPTYRDGGIRFTYDAVRVYNEG